MCTLRIAYDFRILCLQSENNIQQYFNQDKSINYQTLNNYVSDANQMQTVQTIDKSTEHHQNSNCINLKEFLDDTELLKTANQGDTNNSINAPDIILTAGMSKVDKVSW